MIAKIEKGSDGKFYITPTPIGMTGVPFKSIGTATIVCDAINMAYRRGQENVRSDIRNILCVDRREDY